jgi:mannose-binding-like lectin 2
MIDIDGQHEWRDCLDIPGVRLPQGYYFGASAVTGDLSGSTPLYCVLHSSVNEISCFIAMN